MKLIRFGEAGTERPGVLSSTTALVWMSRDVVSDHNEEFFGEAGLKGLANRGNASLFQSGAIQRRCEPLMRANAHTEYGHGAGGRYARTHLASQYS
jgi:hypothetical protein